MSSSNTIQPLQNPASRTVVDGDGQTTTTRSADVDVAWPHTICPERRAFVLQTPESNLDDNGFDEYVEGLCQRFYATHSRRAGPAAPQRLERPFGHLYETGGLRRVHLRGHTNIRKRLLIHTAGFNLGLCMRRLIGVGTPRALQGRLAAVVTALLALTRDLWGDVACHHPLARYDSPLERHAVAESAVVRLGMREMAFTTGC